MEEMLQGFQMQNLIVKNRIVRSATNSCLGNADGSLSDAELKMFEELAKNDIGLIITGHCFVSPKGRANKSQTSICDDTCIEGFKKLTRMLKKYDSKIIAELSHGGAQSVSTEIPIAPSSIEMIPGKPAREMTIDELVQIKTAFINAAYRAKTAGFDGVQVQAAHHYLLSQFITQTTNHRTDLYGGNIENRFRLVKEIISGIKDKCGADFPVFIKLNSSDTPNGRYENELLYMVKECKSIGVEAVEISGDFSKKGIKDHNYFLDAAVKIRKAVDIPIMLIGGTRNLNDINTVLGAGIDMVSICRPLICEPDLIPKLLNGQKESKCRSCNKCFAVYATHNVRCVQHIS